MLTDADRELIAAAVDGDLTPDQSAAFRRLVTASPAATALFEALRSDARRLRALPRVPAPPHLERRVTAQILPTETRPSSAATRSAERGRRPSPRILPYVVAASLLLGVAAGTGWLAVRDANRGDAHAREQRSPTPAGTATHRPSHAAVTFAPAEREALPPPRTIAEAHQQGAPDRAVAVRTGEVAPSPRTSPPAGDVVASGLLNDVRPFDRVELRLPFLASVSDLDRADIRTRLLTELSDSPAFRLDLFTRDPHKAAEVFRAAARSAGVNVMIEAVAADRMRRKIPTAWAVYAEALTPADIGGLLGHLAKATRADKATPFGTAHLIPAQQAEQRDVRELLGVDADAWKRASGPSAPKPISAGTADQVASALTNPSAGSEKAAILLSYLPPNGRANPAASREVKSLLDRRTSRPPDAVPIFIVIRPAD